ncbi:protein lethal(2)essential for life-like [Plutella xylostella]|uniref:Small heat shock protein n=1 Tax=Plutella xylostella TaxID=51655 RepID=A0A0A7BZ25_PLUXY|nr:protein lethal(2)essential for life-like [Plutella xylostella]AHW45917.1 small heat shock protein [Plutella xylostella]
MLSSRLLRSSFLPLLHQTRHSRPTVKISKEKFQLSFDVHNFCKDEIRVKARPESVVIEGKQERKNSQGVLIRKFVRRFKLPIDCDIKAIESKLSPEGVLTITAPRKACDVNDPCELLIPVKEGPSSEDEDVPLIGPCDETSPKVEEPKAVEPDEQKCLKPPDDKKC